MDDLINELNNLNFDDNDLDGIIDQLNNLNISFDKINQNLLNKLIERLEYRTSCKIQNNQYTEYYNNNFNIIDFY